MDRECGGAHRRASPAARGSAGLPALHERGCAGRVGLAPGGLDLPVIQEPACSKLQQLQQRRSCLGHGQGGLNQRLADRAGHTSGTLRYMISYMISEYSDITYDIIGFEKSVIA